ncbi:multidrug effflux MFS transporter [Ahrensia sp. R2A130]|uniref:multidrug effflux MFS transporter n=1 Tax=Ahrensia sp. R2A130 TaxID=744979 RepID=UPI0001E0F075|nr:multidrug effflux MFS transporter [Ahrensia sp. R2A130]EFL90431.1 Bcr/CflA subfamily drug resistance transporter [Ahrensia sp. R2A130]
MTSPEDNSPTAPSSVGQHIPKRPFWKGATTPPSIATLTIIAGLSVMSMNIFLPVLPDIGIALKTTPAIAQYVLTIFLAATAVSQLFIGPLADRFGRRPVLLTTAVIFIAATLLCIFATSIEMLLVGRVLQATSAAAISLSRAIIRDLYDRSDAASMIGYVTMAMAVIPMISPTIGGYTGEAFGWRGPFVVLFFVGILMFALIWFDLGETHTSNPQPPAQQIKEYGSLLREPMVWGYTLCSTLASGAYFAFLGGAPFVGVKIIGMSPSVLGMHFALVAIGYMAGNFLSGRYSKRIGIEPMMMWGGVVCCVGVFAALYLMSLYTPHPLYLFLPMVLVGIGNGMTLPNANAGAVSVRPELAGSASGLAGFFQLAGGAALAALSGSLITIENAAQPLYIIMALSSIGGTAVAWLMWRNARMLKPQEAV